MRDSHWENLKEIFHAAVALLPDERAAYLDRVCIGDQALRAAVESLVKSSDETGNFVDIPAYQAAAEMLVDGVELKLFENDANLDSLRKDERFIAFMAKLKQQWQNYNATF
jgi:hypothetical protein